MVFKKDIQMLLTAYIKLSMKKNWLFWNFLFLQIIKLWLPEKPIKHTLARLFNTLQKMYHKDFWQQTRFLCSWGSPLSNKVTGSLSPLNSHGIPGASRLQGNILKWMGETKLLFLKNENK